jgi:hypothetical protein
LILGAIEERHPRRHVLSVDEKTGIQALERLEGKAVKSLNIPVMAQLA